MWSLENNFSVRLGGNTYINTPNLIAYKGESLFKIYRSENDGMLGIDFDVFGSSGERIATVRNSIVVQGDTSKHTIRTGNEEYSVVENESGRVIVNVRRRNVTGSELDVSVYLFAKDGFLIDASPTHTNIKGNTFTGCVMENCQTGLAID